MLDVEFGRVELVAWLTLALPFSIGAAFPTAAGYYYILTSLLWADFCSSCIEASSASNYGLGSADKLPVPLLGDGFVFSFVISSWRRFLLKGLADGTIFPVLTADLDTDWLC